MTSSLTRLPADLAPSPAEGATPWVAILLVLAVALGLGIWLLQRMRKR